jgi:hypothetical protein
MSEQIVLYLYVALGVVVSIILPLLRPLLPSSEIRGGGGGEPWTETVKSALSFVWLVARPYVFLGIFSLMVALVIFAFMGDTINTWQSAFIAGYISDSTLQKLVTSSAKDPYSSS